MKKKQRRFFIGNFQLLQFINVIKFPLYHIFSITVIFRDGIIELGNEVGGGDFRIRDLFEFFDSLLLSYLLLIKPRNFSLFKLPNRRSIVVQERQYHGSLQPYQYL